MTDTNVTTIKPPIVVLRERLQERRGELKAALTDIDPDHFIRALVTSAQIDPNLQACSFQSLWLACMRACRDNLLPDGREGTIIPFKDKAQWIPMYQGLLKKFQLSGQFRHVVANCVYEGDEFSHYIDEHGEHLRHTPSDTFEDAKIVRVYAMATTKAGGVFAAVLPRKEIDKIRKISRSTREDSPWSAHFSEMAKKTALRRLSKLLPTAPLFEDEEDELPPPREEQAAVEHGKRSPGAASALQAFAGGSSTAPAPTASEGGDPADEGPTPFVAPDAPQDALLTDHYHTAYERGVIARAAGAQRRAIPAEYRDQDNLLEAEAWHAGFDNRRWLNPETGESYGPEDQ